MALVMILRKTETLKQHRMVLDRFEKNIYQKLIEDLSTGYP